MREHVCFVNCNTFALLTWQGNFVLTFVTYDAGLTLSAEHRAQTENTLVRFPAVALISIPLARWM